MSRHIFPLLFIVMLFDSVAYALVNPILTQIFIETIKNVQLPDSAAYQSAFISSFTFLLSPAYLMTGFLAGWLSDKWGRRKLLLGTYMITSSACCTIMIGLLCHSTMTTLLGAILLSVQVANFPLIHATIADISHGIQRARYLAYLFIACSLAMPITLRIMNMSTLPAHSHSFIIIASIGLVLELLSLMLIYFKLPETLAVISDANKIRDLGFFASLARLFNNKPTMIILLLLTLLYFSWGLFEQSIYTYLMHLHFSNKSIDTLMLYKFLSILFILAIIYPQLLKKFSLTSILIPVLAIISLSIFFISTTLHLQLQWIFNILLGIGIAMALSCLWTLLINCVDNSHYGTATGAANFAWTFGWTSSNGLVILYDHSLAPILSTAGCIALFAFALSIKYFVKKPVLASS